MASLLGGVQAAFAGAAFVSLLIAGIAWRNRLKPGMLPLVGVMLSTTVWSGSLLLASLSDFEAARFWLRVMYVGVSVLVVSFFALALAYTGRSDLLTRRTVGLLLLEPAYVTTLAWTNDAHGLFWASMTPAPGTVAGVDRTFGVGFWVHTGVSYVLLGAGVFMLLRLLWQSESVYRGQAAAIVVATVAPWACNALYLFGPISFDATPLGFTVTGVALAFAMFRYQFMDISPVARNTVVDTLSAGVYVLDTDDRFIDVNPIGARMIESTTEEMIGRQFETVLEQYPDLREAFRDSLSATRETEFSFDFRGRHYQVEVSPLEDRGRLVGRVFLVHDVTEQRRRQRDLERQNEQLEQFASVVSHDLRNPLNVASGRVELADETGNLDHLENVRQAHQRMESIIDDVLTLARGSQTVDELVVVDLAEMARGAWNHVDTGEATLEVDRNGQFRADPDRVRRVFENLFRNAIEHAWTDEGPPTVRVGMLGDDDSFRGPRGFYVADDGPGIPPGDRDFVFESGESGSGGTGLGLAIVGSIVEAHDWAIRVTESESGGVADTGSTARGSDSAGGARFEIRAVDVVSGDRDAGFIRHVEDDSD